MINENIDILVQDELNPNRFSQVFEAITHKEQITLDIIKRWWISDQTVEDSESDSDTDMIKVVVTTDPDDESHEIEVYD